MSNATKKPVSEIVEAWDYWTSADGRVRMTLLRWELYRDGRRVCLGPVKA